MQVTRTIAHNALGQFFAISRFHDGSVDEAGPFASSEAAAAEIAQQEQMDAEIEQAEGQAWADDMAQMRWAEAGGYAAGLARPGRAAF